MAKDQWVVHLDGSPKEMGFFAREKPGEIHWSSFSIDEDADWADIDIIEVLRPILFFHAGQKITRGKLKEFFKPKAIRLFEQDGYIKTLKK